MPDERTATDRYSIDIDRSGSADLRETLRLVAEQWRLWVWAVAGTAGALYALRHPGLMGEGWFYEGLFGLVAVVALGLGIRRIRDASTA